jgi:hypothetical protein
MEKKTLYALIGVLVLGSAAYTVMRSPEKGQRQGAPPRPIAQLKAADVAHIEITNEKQEKTVLDKKDGKWRIVEPKDWTADQAAVKTLTDGLEKLAFGDLVSEGADRHADLGVADGKASRLALKDGGGKLIADFYVGKAVSGYTMLRPAGKNGVWQATGIFPYMVSREPKGWRDHLIFEVAQADVDKLTVDTGAAKVTFEKDTPNKDKPLETRWKIAETIGDGPKKVEELDLAAVNGTVQTVTGLHAGDFADDKKPDEVGLGKPQLTDTVSVKGKTYALLVGDTKGDDVYVKRADEPQIYTVKKFSLERLPHKPIDFRDKTLAKVKADELAGIDIIHAGETTALVHDKSGWKGKGKTAVDETKVKPLVSAFENLQGSSFSTEKDPVKTGLKKPAGSVSLHLNTKQTVTLNIGAMTPDKNDYYVQKVGSPDVMLVKKFAIDRFLKKPAELAKK